MVGGDGGYTFLDDITTADVGYRVWGTDLESLFQAAWNGMLAVQIENPGAIRPLREADVRYSASNIELCLHGFLEEQIYLRDAKRLFARICTLRIDSVDDETTVISQVAGEPFDAERHKPGTDVKAVTMYRFQVRKSGRRWEATVVLDV